METDFVTLPAAERLKAINFKERALTYFEDGKPKLHTAIEGWDFNTSFLNCVSRPTYSQAFKWIRDNHMIGHEIMCPFISYSGKQAKLTNGGIYEVFITDEEQLGITDEAFMSHSYDEAQIKVLNFLLKIVESKTK